MQHLNKKEFYAKMIKTLEIVYEVYNTQISLKRAIYFIRCYFIIHIVGGELKDLTKRQFMWSKITLIKGGMDGVVLDPPS